MPFVPIITAAAEGGATVLSSISSDMLNGVLNEVVGLLPVVMPVMIGFIAIRKGISFVIGMLRSA